MTSPGTLQATFAATLVDELARGGVTDAVVCPGSRSSPLAVALVADPRLRATVVLDERSAGFVALGLGLAAGRPAVVLTTSGTAAVNLHPAVVEAHHAGVPLLACTADRPPELHHIGAPQTIDQERIFEGVLRWAVSPGVADEANRPAWRSLASRAVAEALGTGRGPGPVQLNLAFRDPLVGEPGPLPAGRAGGQPWHRVAVAATPPPDDLVTELAGSGRPGVIVAGAGAGGPAALHRLAGALAWPLLADPRSGARLPGPATVAAADALLRSGAFADAHRPELVLRLGAPWASRVVAEWLAGLAAPQYLVDGSGAWLDPHRSAARVVAASPTALADAVVAAGPCPTPAPWLASWQAAEQAAQGALDGALGGQPALTEPGVARLLASVLPEGATLMVSSSMPVRDLEWYARPRKGLRVLSNRGANGIDGVTSTAAGVATAGDGPTYALLGDLAFLHDATGLLAARHVDLTMVVVDNDGGGIFSFLPQATALAPAAFEQVLGTPHGLDLVAVAQSLGARAERVEAAEALSAAVSRPPDGLRVLVVPTDRATNVAAHDHLHQAVASALAALP